MHLRAPRVCSRAEAHEQSPELQRSTFFNDVFQKTAHLGHIMKQHESKRHLHSVFLGEDELSEKTFPFK